MIFIQCTQGSDSQPHGIRFDNLIGLITHLIILSHVHPASDYSLAGSDSLVMPVKDDGDGKWVLPRAASRPVVFQGEHLTQCTLDIQVAGRGRVVTSHPPENPVCSQCGWLSEVGGAGGGCKLYNNNQQQCYLIFISAEPGIDWLGPFNSHQSSLMTIGRKKRRMACLHNEGEFFQLGSKKSELIRKVFTARIMGGGDTWKWGVRTRK